MNVCTARRIAFAFAAPTLIGVGWACTYAPHPAEGKQECYSEKRLCPDGYVCGWDNRCYSEGNVPALPAGTGGVVAGTGGAKAGTGGVISGTGGTKSGTGGVVTGTGGIVHVTVIPGTGGSLPGVGGTMGMGGTFGVDAATTATNTGTVVTIANNQAQGAMTGFGWIASGPIDTVTDPTCGSPAGPLTSSVPCNYTNWSTPDAFCVSGSIPALPASPLASDYDENWGIQIGVSATDPAGSGLGQSFTTITFALTGSPNVALRAMVHRKGDPDTASYCATLTSGVPIALTSFNTTCWDGLGTRITAADVPNIDKVLVQVLSTSVAVAVSNFCLTGVSFGK